MQDQKHHSKPGCSTPWRTSSCSLPRPSLPLRASGMQPALTGAASRGAGWPGLWRLMVVDDNE